MAFTTALHEELQLVAADTEILVDKNSLRFQEYAKRWTDIGREIPAAIVLPTTEADIQHIVSTALVK